VTDHGAVVHGRPVVEKECDLLQSETEPAIDHHVLKARDVLDGVEPVAGRRAPARDHQSNRVVVVQRPHRHAERLGHLADCQSRVRPLVHLRHRGHVPTVRPHVG
jgi:hypothetical protein